MTPDEIATYRTDLLSFTEHMFFEQKGVEFKLNDHQRQICTAIEKVVLGRIKRLIINVPPRAGKTELAVINAIAWCMGNFPDSEFIHASYSKRLATNNTYRSRAIMQHESFAEIFGDIGFSKDSSAKDEFRTDSGGVVYATGADGTITGYGAGKMRDSFGGAIIVDDPHKAGEGNSDTMRQNVLDWFSTTVESRKNSPHTPIIIIMQRLHENDLSGFLLGGGNGEHWDHLSIPAADNDMTTSFWEEQFPIEDLSRMSVADSYKFAGQYMQNPAPIGGGIFKDGWWQHYDVAPVCEWRAIYADTAQKTKDHNDYSVFQCWGRTQQGQAVLLDVIRGKWEAPDLLQQAKAFWAKHKAEIGMGVGTLRYMAIEDKVSGTGLIQTLKREGMPIRAVQRNTDKITRAMDVAPQIESGRVMIPSAADWLSDFMREHSQFPNATNDDMVDPCMDAIQDMLINPSSHVTAKVARPIPTMNKW
jgi:predicted phage terminase large subunit-like protein